MNKTLQKNKSNLIMQSIASFSSSLRVALSKSEDRESVTQTGNFAYFFMEDVWFA